MSSISHLIGAIASVAGLVLLVLTASLEGNPWKIVSFSIYGSTLLLLYLFSTLYHRLSGGAKTVFRKLDHCAIYLLIAGTYTPFMLVTLRNGWGWTVFGIIWGIALFGIVWDSLSHKGIRAIPVIVYLLMGWLVLLVVKPLLEVLPSSCLYLLLFGGISYTTGVLFYAMDKKSAYFHGIWHIFVLVGSTCHYLSVFIYVA